MIMIVDYKHLLPGDLVLKFFYYRTKEWFDILDGPVLVVSPTQKSSLRSANLFFTVLSLSGILEQRVFGSSYKVWRSL